MKLRLLHLSLNCLLLFSGLSLSSQRSAIAGSGSLPFDASEYTDLANLFLQDAANTVLTTAGLFTQHRPYDPTSFLGMFIGFDLSAEAGLVQIPKPFETILKSAGVEDVSDYPNSFPISKIHVSKGILPFLDVGISGIKYQTFFVLGGDIKFKIYEPEEGLLWAFRMCYTSARLGFVRTQTYSPQIMTGIKLDYMEPYVGVAYQVVQGTIKASYTLLGHTLELQKDGAGSAFEGFLGMAIRIGPTGLRLVLEGAYNTAGFNHLGLKFGLNF